MAGSAGLTHCGVLVAWMDLDKRITPNGNGGLRWEWLCPLCGDVIRSEPFGFPPDFPREDEDRVGCEG